MRKRLTTEQIELNAKVHLLQLDVSRIECELSSATHPRRIAQLQAALDYLTGKLRELA